MSRRRSGISNIQAFNFQTESSVVAQKFRDYCYQKRLVMGATFEKMMVDFLIAENVVASEEHIRVEEALTK